MEGTFFIGIINCLYTNNIRYADTFLIAPTNKNLTSYAIKEGTRYFDKAAFSGCKNITSVGVVKGSGTSIKPANRLI